MTSRNTKACDCSSSQVTHKSPDTQEEYSPLLISDVGQGRCFQGSRDNNGQDNLSQKADLGLLNELSKTESSLSVKQFLLRGI